MTRAVVVIRRGSPHHVQWCGAMVEGLNAHGIQTYVTDTAAGNGKSHADFAVCWGWRIGSELRRSGLNVLVMEAGHLPERLEWASCGWNGLGARALRPESLDAGERFETHWGGLLQPWRSRKGSEALLLGQCVGDSSLETMFGTYEQWMDKASRALVQEGFSVRYRAHPKNPGTFCPEGSELATGATLERDFETSDLVVTFNSTAGVEAALFGVPVLAFDQGAMVWDVACRSLSSKSPHYTPDRTAWANRLAWAQYTLDEVRSGTAWAIMSSLMTFEEVA